MSCRGPFQPQPLHDCELMRKLEKSTEYFDGPERNGLPAANLSRVGFKFQELSLKMMSGKTSVSSLSLLF